jgi:rod shape-determining protein MreD
MALTGLLFIVGGLISTALQGVLLHLGVPPYLLPQLVVLLIVYLSFTEVSVFGSFLAFALGLILDFSSAILVGPWAGAMVAVYGVLALLSQRLFIDSSIVAIVTTFGAVLFGNILYMLLAYEYRLVEWGYVGQAFGEAFVTALLAPLVFGFLKRRFKRRSVSSYARSMVGPVS